MITIPALSDAIRDMASVVARSMSGIRIKRNQAPDYFS